MSIKSLSLQKCSVKLENLVDMLMTLQQSEDPRHQGLQELDLDIGDLKEAEVSNAIIPMLQQNTSLKALHLMHTKIPIEITCQLLQAMGRHASLKKVLLKNSKLGCVLEAELRRFERAILEMA